MDLLQPSGLSVLGVPTDAAEMVKQQQLHADAVAKKKTAAAAKHHRRNAAGVGCVMEMDVASDKHPSHWILESAALILNSDD